jgi:arsenate reductase (thioredoxin)
MTASTMRAPLFASMTVATLMAGPSAGADGSATKGEAKPRPVLFVCEHGSAKSLVAASFFERMAKERGMAVRAVSRGTSPDASVPAAVVEALRGDGFDVAAFKPQLLNDTDILAAARVVSIGVDIGEAATKAAARVERWDDVPAFSASYPKARKVILARIDSLLRQLEQEAREGR